MSESKAIFEPDHNGKEDKKWVARRNTRVAQILDRVRNGSKDASALVRLANSIEHQWGDIENFGRSWVDSVKASQDDNPGSHKTLTAFRDMAKVFIGIQGSLRGTIDLSEVDDDTLKQLDVAESLVQMLIADPWILRDLIGMVPTFDDSVLVMILREKGYVVTGAETVLQSTFDIEEEAVDGND